MVETEAKGIQIIGFPLFAYSLWACHDLSRHRSRHIYLFDRIHDHLEPDHFIDTPRCLKQGYFFGGIGIVYNDGIPDISASKS